MNFEGDAFISYAHLDNVCLVEGRKGWVANLHRALQVRVAQLLGKEARIWWDPKLQGNDDFAITLADRLHRVASLVAVVSPRYIKSEWGRREIEEFCQAAGSQGGVRIHDKARIFKILKTPVPRDQHPEELQPLLGYEFFKVDPETGRVRELDEIFGPEAQREFWLKLDDLAHDMCALLQLIEPDAAASPDPNVAPAAETTTVYLAVTTNDLKDSRDALKRDLEQHGHVVLPDRPLPASITELEATIREALSRCQMSIHMIGATYGLVPEAGQTSIIEVQHELAIERAKTGLFSRLIWIPPGLETGDTRQQQLLDRLRSDPRQADQADLIERPLDELETVIEAWLQRSRTPPSVAPAVPTSPNTPQVYLIYDQRDTDAIGPWADYLFHDFEVIQPSFTGDEADVRQYHEDNLKTSDGVLIFYGAGNECWLRRKLREIEKSAGYGRTKPATVVGICQIAPKTPEKERFRTHSAIVMPQWDGLAASGLSEFVAQLKHAAVATDDTDGGTP